MGSSHIVTDTTHPVTYWFRCYECGRRFESGDVLEDAHKECIRPNGHLRVDLDFSENMEDR